MYFQGVCFTVFVYLRYVWYCVKATGQSTKLWYDKDKENGKDSLIDNYRGLHVLYLYLKVKMSHSSLNFTLHWTCTRQLAELPALYFVSQSQTARFRQFKLRVQMIWGLRFQTNSTFLIVKVLFVLVKCKKMKFSRNIKSLTLFAMFVEKEILSLIEMRFYQGRGRGG